MQLHDDGVLAGGERADARPSGGSVVWRDEGSRGRARTNIAGVTPFRWPASDEHEPGGNKATLTLTGIDARLGSRPY